MTVKELAFAGAVALPAVLTFIVFLFANVLAPDSEAGLLWVIVPVMVFPAAIVGAVLGALIGAVWGKGR